VIINKEIVMWFNENLFQKKYKKFMKL
jgi:hypothetical protein